MKISVQTFNFFIVSAILIFAFSLNFFGEILNGIYLIGFTDELGILLVLCLGVYILLSLRKVQVYNKDFLILFPLLTLVYVFFYYETFISFVYEYYKLFIFLVFLPVLKFFNAATLQRFLKLLHKLFLLVLSINFVFIILQYITKNAILAKIGYSELRVSGWEKIGRYTGLFDVGTLGATALLILMLNEIGNKGNKSHKHILILGVLSVIFSSSKASYAILILWIFIYFRKQLLKHFLKIIAGVAAIGTVVFFYTYEAIVSKIIQYQFFLENLYNPKIVNLANVEMRAMFWAQSIKIVQNNPFGLGLGTFGDASSKYNPEAYKMPASLWPDQFVYLSDSALSHVIAEQGITCLLYLFVLFFPLLKAHKNAKVYVYMLICFYFVQVIFTMGFSAGTWPLLFALLYAILYYSKSKKINSLFEKAD